MKKRREIQRYQCQSRRHNFSSKRETQNLSKTLSQLKKFIKLHQGLCKSNKVEFIDEFLSAYKEEVRVKNRIN
jgi:transposase-like protein